jgi:hypothetical protein
MEAIINQFESLKNYLAKTPFLPKYRATKARSQKIDGIFYDFICNLESEVYVEIDFTAKRGYYFQMALNAPSESNLDEISYSVAITGKRFNQIKKEVLATISLMENEMEVAIEESMINYND